MASLKSEGINHVCIAVAVQVPTERVWKVGEAILSGYLLVMTNIKRLLWDLFTRVERSLRKETRV